jgi:two-component system, OmpR family, response regulator ResD
VGGPYPALRIAKLAGSSAGAPTHPPTIVHMTDPADARSQAAPRRVLVVEDDPNLSEVVARYLQREGFTVEVRDDGQAGLEHALEWLPDLVVLDVLLPGLDGFEVCRQLRQSAPIPVVMLTARAEEDDRVLGLELGADDYVTKPFSPRELTARIKAVLRRASTPLPGATSPERGPLRAGSLEVDTVAHETLRAGVPVHLTAREFDLLVHLMDHPRTAFRREELLETVWGWTYGDAATVTVHMRRLRIKLEEDPTEPRHLITVSGGYRFEP